MAHATARWKERKWGRESLGRTKKRRERASMQALSTGLLLARKEENKGMGGRKGPNWENNSGHNEMRDQFMPTG